MSIDYTDSDQFLIHFSRLTFAMIRKFKMPKIIWLCSETHYFFFKYQTSAVYSISLLVVYYTVISLRKYSIKILRLNTILKKFLRVIL